MYVYVVLSQFRERAEFSKLNCGESVDVHFKKNVRKRSYASLVTQRKRETPAVDISVSGRVGGLLTRRLFLLYSFENGYPHH